MVASLQFDLFAGHSATFAENEDGLITLALALGAAEVPGWSRSEEQLVRCRKSAWPAAVVRDLRERIASGADPLGEQFCRLRTAAVRRSRGATYTPPAIVRAMVEWSAELGQPRRVVDPGTASGRFLLAAGRRFRRAELLGVEIDPLAALLARANLAAAGFSKRSRVLVADYREHLPRIESGATLFIGNPPYVRHHTIESRWKRWLIAAAGRRGIMASGLAGLHAHFYVATADHARPGDFGCLITSAEWLDVNYGSVIRELLLGELGLDRLAVVEPSARPFPDAATTAVVTRFRVGERPPRVSVWRVDDAARLSHPNGCALSVRRERLAAGSRWTPLTRRRRPTPAGHVELGELCRVHRGQVTGNNGFWTAGPHSRNLPESVLFPSITKARELFEAGAEIESAAALRLIIDLPPDLEVLSDRDRKAVERFLAEGRKLGIPEGYIASNRKPWWSVRLREPAPILATYMARRPPAFVYNHSQVRHINIAHGIYPREPLEPAVLVELARYLSSQTRLESGRMYAGGLTKFEPREMERLLVPRPEVLRTGVQ
ncbi:MAG TPA: N-6 DNA methylase [Planctomycetaceae bacterium]|nr:N-6 DNA methylase [Planctomycetaceae bacterium]